MLKLKNAEIDNKVTNSIGQEIWDTRLINAGVYFYTLQGEGLSKTGKIVISK